MVKVAVRHEHVLGMDNLVAHRGRHEVHQNEEIKIEKENGLGVVYVQHGIIAWWRGFKIALLLWGILLFM